ncbi:MAG: acyl-CoA reductase-like NAD-dependent aldehyde dehydrogenase [Gammaproteobacteria bacterium]|jgi:acyl-CoA reductase-like NAD-dependent aldehyde dehydrogenase
MTKHFSIMVPEANSKDALLEVVAPYDGTLIATVDTADSSVVEKALTTASSLYKNRDSWLPAEQRIHILEKTIDIMQERQEVLAVEAAREGGKPLLDSRVEVARAIDGVKLCIETLRTESGREIPMGLNAASSGRLAFTRKEPIGVVVAVSAFNHPLNLIVHQVTPAIATGCPVIVKPAEDTPLSCFRFVEILREAGLPDEWCQAFVVSDLNVATQLVTDDRVDFFTFIGSAKVGWMLRSKLSPGTRCALEHGGAAPVIVAEDADIEDALPLLAKGGFYHAGQVCVSVQRIFAHHSIAKDLAQAIAKTGEQYSVGDPTLADTDIGPLIRHAETDRVESWVNEAVAEGAELISGGKRISDSCYECTVLYNPSNESKVSQMEIFGPVICVYPYEDINVAIEQANALPFSFQASVFTRNIDKAMRVSKRINASAVMVNDHTAFRVDWMPFAGLKQSGLGVGGIPYTMEDMQIEKMTVLRSREL